MKKNIFWKKKKKNKKKQDRVSKHYIGISLCFSISEVGWDEERVIQANFLRHLVG